MSLHLAVEDILPKQGGARLVGRAWVDAIDGPVVVGVYDGRLRNLSALAPTMSELLELRELTKDFDSIGAEADLGALSDFAPFAKGDSIGRILAPCDLQAVKAAGVTFADSMLERVIEEQAKGDPSAAAGIRAKLQPIVGENLKGVVAGSDKAAEVKKLLQDEGMWSQYLEVGIGPDAEIFTKAPPMASVGVGADIGIHPISDWNNPEPEVVLAVNARGQIAAVTLGNDVNLRDVEGRSALLLGKAKDNNASCAIGPFLRLIDEEFTIDSIDEVTVSLRVTGDDGFELTGDSPMSQISRSPRDLAGQTLNANHQYPDGAMLFLGTMFAPTKDRRKPGDGFTHEIGDIVTISAPQLGALVNRVKRTNDIEPWTFGAGALMRNLAKRGLL